MKNLVTLATVLALPQLLPAAPADTLVGYWKMEGDNGPTVVDSAAAGASTDTATWVGTPAYPAAVFGDGLLLSGSNYLSIPNSTDTDKEDEDMTISLWCRIDQWDTNWQTLLAKGEYYRYRIARRGGINNQLSFGGGTNDIYGTTNINNGQWHHVAAVTEHGVQTRLYVDGTRIAQSGSPPPALDNNSNPLLIGANPDTNPMRQWKGGIDDLGLFDEAFDNARVAALYALATDPGYRYDLGTFNELLKLHSDGPAGAPLTIGSTTWTYAAANPGGGLDFFALDGSGSGVVANPGVIESFTATPQYIAGGQSSTLQWQTPGFSSLSIDDGAAPVDVTSLPELVVSPAVTTTYTLTGTNPFGSQSADLTVFVNVPPSVALSATDDTILSGAGTTLQWTSTGADTLSIDQGIGDVMPATDASGSGSAPLPGVAATTTYTITATNPAGSVTDSVTVTTGTVPVINSFTIADPYPVPNAMVDFSWTITAADTASISPSVGAVDPLSGTASDSPALSTTYTLTASNPFGQATATATATLPARIAIDQNLWTVLHRRSTGAVNNLADADALLAGSNVAASAAAGNVPVVNYGPSDWGEFPADTPPPLGTGVDEFALRATATLVVNLPGEYTFGINNDDGGRLRIDGVNIIVDDAWHGTLTNNGVARLTAGTHSIEYVFFDSGGGDAGEVFFVNAGGYNQLLGFSAPVPPIVTTDVILNEFMADNNRTLDDFEGQSSDWIELYNGSGATIDLAGYYLTDDDTLPDKYPIPSYLLPDGGFLVLFASGKDTVFGSDEFHTNFKLGNNGEYLGLYKDDGAGGLTVVTEFAPTFPPQEEDASYGSWGSTQDLGFMPIPTPGTLNAGGVDGFLGDTHFDVDRGLFDTPFHLTITTDDPAATIRYTLDGSEPTINHGTLFTTPIAISQTTVVRAAGFLQRYAPTNIDTQTYIFPADVPLQDQALAVGIGFPANDVNGQRYEYGMAGGSVSDPEIVRALADIPSISLVMEQEDFSSAQTGIFSNAGRRGRGWERPGSVELINEHGLGTGQFQKNCGVRIRGGYSRSDNNPKHAFRLFFRGSYEGDLDYPVFQDEGPSRFENLDLRTSQNYSWAFGNDPQNTFLREIHGRDAQREMEQPYTRSRYYHLYINGIYWGLYMSQERSEDAYGETYFGGDEDDYDVIKSAGNDANYTTEATNGDLNGAWLELWTKVRALRSNPADNAAYFALQGLAPDGISRHPDPLNNPDLLEVDNLIDYLLAIFYTGNFDAPLSTFIQASNNWYGIRNRNGPDGFRFFVHDGEHSLGCVTDARSDDRVGPWGDQYTNNPPSDFTRSNPHYLHEDLAWNPEYRIAFADRVHKHFFNGGVFTEPASLTRLDLRYQEINDAVRAELARWGRGYNYTTWLNARQDIINYISNGSTRTSGIGRAAYIVNLLRNYNHGGSKPLYPWIDAPRYAINGGAVPTGFVLGVSNPNPAGTVYYTTDGSDPRLPGGNISPLAAVASGSVTLTASGPLISRVWNSASSTWSAANDFGFIVGVAGSAANLVVSEIHYNPTSTPADSFPNKDDYEFIELFNLSATDTIELTGTRFSAGISFDFTASNVTRLAPGQRLVVVSNLAAFSARYPQVPPTVIAGEYTGNLDNSGERLTLTDAVDAVIKDFTYNDNLPWPTAPDGEGYSLALNLDLTNPDHGAAANWRSHATLHGNPGGPDGSTWTDWVADHGLTGLTDADADHDDNSDLFEYAAATDPLDAGDRPPLSPGFRDFFVDGSFQQLPTVTVRRNLDAGDVVSYPEISTDLVTWSSAETELVMVESVNQGDGTELVTWRSTSALGSPGGARLFLRLRVDGQ